MRLRAKLPTRPPTPPEDDDALTDVRDPSCLSGREQNVGKALGKGSFGSVYAILDDRGRPTDYVLKVSNLRVMGDHKHNSMARREEEERRDTFEREVYYLDRLKDQYPQLVPRLKNWRVCAGQGLQVMERFDGSTKELGQQQVRDYGGGGLNPDDNWAFTREQLQSMAALVERLDQLGIGHFDLKAANVFVKNNGRTFVIADFGFSGDFRKGARFSPMMGFSAQYGCPADITEDAHGHRHLTHPVPGRIVPFWNRIQLIINLLSRNLFVLDRSAGRLGEQITPKQLLRIFDVPTDALPELIQYCPQTHEIFR
jgi:serine/threonine protein kinase